MPIVLGTNRVLMFSHLRIRPLLLHTMLICTSTSIAASATYRHKFAHVNTTAQITTHSKCTDSLIFRRIQLRLYGLNDYGVGTVQSTQQAPMGHDRFRSGPLPSRHQDKNELS